MHRRRSASASSGMSTRKGRRANRVDVVAWVWVSIRVLLCVGELQIYEDFSLHEDCSAQRTGKLSHIATTLAPLFPRTRLLCSRVRVSELDGPVDQIEAQDGPVPCDRRVHVLHAHADVVHRQQREICPLRELSASALVWI